MSETLAILNGDCRDVLKSLLDDSVDCCVTSPPYWGLRNYNHQNQIGWEDSVDEFVKTLTAVFSEVYRVLKPDGTLWLNLGDSYASGPKNRTKAHVTAKSTLQGSTRGQESICKQPNKITSGLKPKDLCMIPARVALALQSSGWYLRSDIVWHKPNCMPESVTDRPSRCHEYLFLMSKSEKYHYDHEAIKEPCSESYVKDSRWVTGPKDSNSKSGYEDSGAQNPKRVHAVFKNVAVYNGKNRNKQSGHGRRHAGFNERWDASEANGHAPLMRNKRDVWTVSPAIYLDAHFATYPPELIKPCILAGCRPGGVVLDPFAGSGTTGAVALELGRRAILIELNPDYIPLIEQRCSITQGLPI